MKKTTTYQVTRDFPQNGEIHRVGGTIDLTEKQAKFLLHGGFIAPMKPVSRETGRGARRGEEASA